MSEQKSKDRMILIYLLVGVFCITIALLALHWAASLAFFGCFLVVCAVSSERAKGEKEEN